MSCLAGTAGVPDRHSSFVSASSHCSAPASCYRFHSVGLSGASGSGAADKIGLTGAARDLFIAGVNTSVGAAAGGAAGAAAAHNEVVNNYLSSQQWRDFAKDLDQCQKSGGDCTSVVNRYRNISNDQDTQLASACRDLNSPGCRSMVAEVVGGRDAQIGLAIDGKLPANFIGGADLQGNGNLYERKVQAQDIVNACAADPTGCDQQRLRGSAQLLLTGVSIGALAVAAPGMAVEAGALVAEGATLYCARRPDSCVALAETLGSTLGGVPQTGVGGSSIASRGARGGAPATGIAGAGAGAKGEVPEVVAGAGATGRGAAAAGSEAAIPTGRDAVPAPEPEVGKPNNLASGETRQVGRGTDAANDPVYEQGPAEANVVTPKGGGSSTADVVLPGMDRPVRQVNVDYPPIPSVVDAMNSPQMKTWVVNTGCIDCSEIAPKLLEAAGGKGQILEVRPIVSGQLNVFENGVNESGQSFHQVYTDGQYVYDPRLLSRPIPKGDWEQHIRNINPAGITISSSLKGLK
ncbi:DUF6862 domain-containing protein [Sphingomonas sp. NCPPB 2930]